MRLRWTLAAANDLEIISDYLHHQHPQFAQSTVRRLYAEIRELRHFPSRGRPGRETGTRDHRSTKPGSPDKERLARGLCYS